MVVICKIQAFRLWVEEGGTSRKTSAIAAERVSEFLLEHQEETLKSTHHKKRHAHQPSSSTLKRRRRVDTAASSATTVVPIGAAPAVPLPGRPHLPFFASCEEVNLPTKQRLELDILKRQRQVRNLRRCMTKGVYNSVILPEEGMLDEDDINDRYIHLPGGAVVRELASPAVLSDAQRDKLFLQCFTLSELLRALNRRDEDYLLAMAEHEKSSGLSGRGRGRVVVPTQPTFMSIVDQVLVDLDLENPCAETLRNWYSMLHTYISLHACTCVTALLITTTDFLLTLSTCIFTCRHQEFVENGERFRQSKIGKYESAWIMEENEDMITDFKVWMCKNRRQISSGKAANFLNDVLLKNLPGSVLQSYGITLPVCDNTGWRWLKKCGAKSEKHQMGYYNDHHDCA